MKAGKALLAAILVIFLLPIGAARGIDPYRVAACQPFTLFRGHSKHSGHYAYQARSVRRSAAITCYMTRKLLKAAYGGGPLHAIRTVYARDSRGRRVGRPTYWLRGGWRCSNGAGGAACWNAEKLQFNAIEVEGLTHGFAVSAEV